MLCIRCAIFAPSPLYISHHMYGSCFYILLQTPFKLQCTIHVISMHEVGLHVAELHDLDSIDTDALAPDPSLPHDDCIAGRRTEAPGSVHISPQTCTMLTYDMNQTISSASSKPRRSHIPRMISPLTRTRNACGGGRPHLVRPISTRSHIALMFFFW